MKNWYTPAKCCKWACIVLFAVLYVCSQIMAENPELPLPLPGVAALVLLLVVAAGGIFCYRRAKGRRDWVIDGLLALPVLLVVAAMILGNWLGMSYWLAASMGLLFMAMFPWPLAAMLTLLVLLTYIYRRFRHAKEQ